MRKDWQAQEAFCIQLHEEISRMKMDQEMNLRNALLK